MTTRLPRLVALSLLALAVALPLGACSKRRELPAREGLGVEVDGLAYTVFITRELNLRDPEDKAYFQGPDAPPGSAYYGVFLQVCNETDRTRYAVRSFDVVTTRGERFSPIPLDGSNPFRYTPQAVAPHRCLPTLNSIAQQGPTNGMMLLFRIPNSAIENRPLDLEIGPTPGQRTPDTRRIELDI
ncbi:MAG: hypothetical protein IRZ21_12705 [Thermoleophilaceae bacterium]|nr:hypothetical protein [Thermoleophilaceae bacterium]